MRRPALTLAALGLALALGACSDSSSPADPNNPNNPNDPPGNEGSTMNAAVAAQIGYAAADEVDESNAFLLAGLDGMIDGRGPAPAPLAIPTLPEGCMTVAPLPPEDPDGDHIPTSLTATWDGTACQHDRMGHGITFFGTWSISDPVPEVAGWDLDQVLDEVGATHTRPTGVTVTAVRNGTRTVRGSDQGLEASEEITTLREVTDQPAMTVHKQWDVSYTVDAGASLVYGEEKPSGSIAGTGAWTFEVEGQYSHLLEVETVTPLHYNNSDDACTSQEPHRRIDAGELLLTRTVDGAEQDKIRVTWSACGTAPTYEHVTE